MANMSAKILSDSNGIIADAPTHFSREEYHLNPNNRTKPQSALVKVLKQIRYGRNLVSENPAKSMALAAFVGILAGGLVFAATKRSARSDKQSS